MKRNSLMTKFDISNLKYMPSINLLDLSQNNLAKIGNATFYCHGSACTNLEILFDQNPIPCDKHMCWAKMNTSITVKRDSCLAKQWINVTLDDLPCPTGKCFLCIDSDTLKQVDCLQLYSHYTCV